MPAYQAWNSLSQSRKAVLLFTLFIIAAWTLISLRANDIIPTLSSPPATIKRSKYAYATILTADGDIEFPDIDYPYFRAARLLSYQLLHNPHTRGNNTDGNIPFLVLVTEDVPQRHRDILARDGATIVPVESLGRQWVRPKWEQWNGVLAKLNLWRLTEYDKILFLDADSILFRPIDGLFSDPMATVQTTLSQSELPADGSIAEEEKEDDDDDNNIPLPDTYLIAGINDSWMEWALRQRPGKKFYAANNYMNAGFFIFSPSRTLFDYYISLLDIPGRFDPSYPEQNLLNNAHRTDGRMPWRDLGTLWNQKEADQAAYHNGLKSVHHKWWHPLPDPILRAKVENVMKEMKEFHREREVAGWPKKIEFAS